MYSPDHDSTLIAEGVGVIIVGEKFVKESINVSGQKSTMPDTPKSAFKESMILVKNYINK